VLNAEEDVFELVHSGVVKSRVGSLAGTSEKMHAAVPLRLKKT